jgi:chitin synthase
VAFIAVFGVILVIQFIAMLFHRFGTLEHMLSTTQINWFGGGAQVGTVPLKTALGTIVYLR